MSEHAAPAPSSGRCVYGYALFLVSNAALVVYLLWAFIPSHWFHLIGITYLPTKYWALAFPLFVCIGIFAFATCLYPSINFIFTPPFTSTQTITDSHARKADLSSRLVQSQAIPPICDLPIDFVCQKLYSH